MNGIVNNSSLNFKSGLTLNIIKDFRRINPVNAETDFKRIGVNAQFRNSKFLSGATTLVCDILNDISNKYKLPFDSQPLYIRVFKNRELVDMPSQPADGFCITDTKKVIKSEGPFVGGSIFFKSPVFDSVILESMRGNNDYSRKYCSSSHFLRIPMHEWFHNIHLNLIYKKYGYDGICPVMKKMYPNKKPSGLEKAKEIDSNLYILPEDKAYIEKYLGKYSVAEGSLFEIFAELMTKITTQSLDKNLNVIKNPLDNLPNDLPKFFRKFLENTLNI